MESNKEKMIELDEKVCLKDKIADFAKEILFETECSLDKCSVDAAINMATYFYEKIYYGKSNVKSKEEIEEEKENKQRIEYLLEAKKQIEDLLKKCQSKQK